MSGHSRFQPGSAESTAILDHGASCTLKYTARRVVRNENPSHRCHETLYQAIARRQGGRRMGVTGPVVQDSAQPVEGVSGRLSWRLATTPPPAQVPRCDGLSVGQRRTAPARRQDGRG